MHFRITNVPKIYFSAFPTINLKLVLYCEECLESSFPKSLQVAPPFLPYGAFALKHALFIFSPISAFGDTSCHHMQREHIRAAAAAEGQRIESVANAFCRARVNIPPGSRYPFQLGCTSRRGRGFCSGDLSNSCYSC